MKKQKEDLFKKRNITENIGHYNVDFFEGDIDNLINRLQVLKQNIIDNRDFYYESIFFEVSRYYDDVSVKLCGTRQETDGEFNLRLKNKEKADTGKLKKLLKDKEKLEKQIRELEK